MKREVYVKKFIGRDEDFVVGRGNRQGNGDGMRINEGRRENRNNATGNGYNRVDKGVGNHLNGGRRDSFGPHIEEGCNIAEKKHQSFRRNRFENKVKTKMFTSKKELVEFVNKVGELGNKVDIYKIEEELYKVVVVERYTEEIKEEV